MLTVVNLGKHTGHANKWSVEQMLADEIATLQSGERVATKALALFLDDTDGAYNVGYGNAGLSASQMLALLEVAKTMVLKDMGYL